jgi:hypothetical protein
MVPSQKTGIVTPRFARTVTTVSTQVALFKAQTIPAGIPIKRLMMKAGMLMFRVTGIVLASIASGEE